MLRINYDKMKTVCVVCYYDDGQVMHLFFDMLEDAEEYAKEFDTHSFSHGYKIVPANIGKISH